MKKNSANKENTSSPTEHTYSHSQNNSPTYSKLNNSNPVIMRASRLMNQRPKSLIVGTHPFASQKYALPSNGVYNQSQFHSAFSSTSNNNPTISHNHFISSSSSNNNYYRTAANQYNDSAINEMINLALKKPELTIKRGKRGYGFMLSTTPVYYDDTDIYSIQHIILSLEDRSPAQLAGLKVI